MKTTKAKVLDFMDADGALVITTEYDAAGVITRRDAWIEESVLDVLDQALILEWDFAVTSCPWREAFELEPEAFKRYEREHPGAWGIPVD